MIQKILFAYTILLLTSLSYAQPMSSNVLLGGGVAAPTQALNIPLTKLVKGISYNITCDINTYEASSKDPVIVNIYMQSNFMQVHFGEVLLNDVSIGYGQVQTKLPATTAKLDIMQVSSYDTNDALIIQNADQDHEVKVGQCIAIARG